MKIERTTITVTKEFRNELEELKENDESIETMLKRMLKGSKQRIPQTNEPIAFTLEYYDNHSEKVQEKFVGWHELVEAEVGQRFSFTDIESDCVVETAKVIYRCDDYLLVEFRTNGYENNKQIFSEINLNSFNFFRD